MGHLAGVLATTVIALAMCIRDQTLREMQFRQQRTILMPELNQQLYAHAERLNGSWIIATDYQGMPWLPGLESRSVRMDSGCELSQFRSTYDRPDVRYALVWHKGVNPSVQDYLRGAQGKPAGQLVFEANGYCFYEKP
jgi:hypothetical protein